MPSAVRNHRLHLAVLVLNIIAVATLDIVPTIEAGARSTLGFGTQDASAFSSVFMAGNVLGAIFSLFWVRRVRWPVAVGVSLSGIALFNGLSAFVGSAGAFIALQGLLGVCSSSLYSLTLTIMSDEENPDRHFGILIGGQVAFQAVGLLLGPVLLDHGGLPSVMVALAALGLVGLPLARLLPDRGRSAPPTVDVRQLLRPAALVAFAGCFAFYLSTWSYWTYIEAIGHDAGFANREVANALAIGVAAGFAGASAASWIGRNLPRLWLLGAAAAMLVMSVWLLASPVTIVPFIISGCLFNFSWNFSLAYQYAIVNSADTTARAVALTPAVHTAGGMTGPVIGILVLRPHDFNGVLWLVALGVLASQVLFVVASALSSRGTQAP